MKNDLASLCEEFQDVEDIDIDKANKVLQDAKVHLDAFNGRGTFVGSTSQRFAERCSEPGKEAVVLEKYLKLEKSIVIFTSEAMGPDLIILLWIDNVPLVILVHSKSGKTASAPQAILSLKQLYETNRKSGKASMNPLAQGFEEVIRKYGGRTALVLVKPMEGVLQQPVQVKRDGKLQVIVHKNSWNTLFPELKEGIENLRKFKRDA